MLPSSFAALRLAVYCLADDIHQRQSKPKDSTLLTFAVWPTLYTMTPTYLSTTHLLPPRPTRTQCPFGNWPDADLCGMTDFAQFGWLGNGVAFTFEAENRRLTDDQYI
ncbi:hypothetical protein C8R43DRAFT_1012508 [Mycena crocata]|nr:hypothetical protein C8R43DRAFT_1012508 [Mycena crocata]